ncbi:MAG: Fic family protein [Burkholderiales bacterium]
MATYGEKLASSMVKLKALQTDGRIIIRANELTRTHLERLVNAGYLRLIVKGWYMPSRPEEHNGDTTAWHASLREFVRGYCDDRFGDEWYLNAETSLLLHTGSTTVPKQILVNARLGKNNHLKLPAESSLYDYAAKDFAPAELRTEVQGLRALSLEAALVRAAPNLWISDPLTLRLALGQLRDVTSLSRILLNGGNSVVAGRLAGALEILGKPDFARELVDNMNTAGYIVNKSNPFNVPVEPVRSLPESPYCGRIRAMWKEMREDILATWSVPKQPPTDVEAYLAEAEERYVTDAYHSLSIEGYRVTPELIEKVRNNAWEPEAADRGDNNALAARGYYEAHLEVRESLRDVLTGANAGQVLRQQLQSWYRALWGPAMRAGIFKPSDLAGWRAWPIYIRNSEHVPLPADAVRDAMPLLFELLLEETEPHVQAVLGHFVFVYIHPYMDGNGRLARFLLNLMLARGGWPWTVVTMDSRNRYMEALEEASVRKNIRPFTEVISELVSQQLLAAPQRTTKSVSIERL